MCRCRNRTQVQIVVELPPTRSSTVAGAPAGLARPGGVAGGFGKVRPSHQSGGGTGRCGRASARPVHQPPADVASAARADTSRRHGVSVLPHATPPAQLHRRCIGHGALRVTRDRTGLVHVTVPLVLGEHALGALVAGQVFDQYPEQLVLEHVAVTFGLRPAAGVAASPPGTAGQARHLAGVCRPTGDARPHLPPNPLRHGHGSHRLAEMTRLRDLLQQRTQDTYRGGPAEGRVPGNAGA